MRHSMVSEVGPASISVERAPERIGYGGSEEARSAHNKERGDRDDANERVSGWNPLKDPRSPNQAEVSRLSPPVKRRRSERSPSIGSSRSGHQPPSAHEEEDELDETARDGYSTRRSTARHYLARHHDSNPRKTPRLSDPEWASSSKQRSASGKMSEQDRVDRAASPGAAYHTSNGGPDRWQSSMRRQERAESRSANDDAMMLRRAATHPRSHHGEDYRPSMSSRPGSSGKRSASGSSTGDMPPSAADPRDRNEAAAYRRERGEDPRDADYVWNSGTTPGGGVMSIAALNGGGGAGASGISSRGNTLPPLGVRSMPPVPSATSRSLTPSTHQMQQSRFPPSPRLPSFAALQQPDTPASAGTSVTLSTTSNGSTIATTAMSNPDQSGSVHQGMPGRPLSQLPPFMGSQPISNADRSPSQSSSHAAGHPLIHPSLAGLPGTGGGGSKQQPSFVSKLYS